jgi:hypothetical protein
MTVGMDIAGESGPAEVCSPEKRSPIPLEILTATS